MRRGRISGVVRRGGTDWLVREEEEGSRVTGRECGCFWGWCVVRDCFTIARGMLSCCGTMVSASVSLSLSRMEGSVGGEGERTHLFEEYLVLIKFSILESEGMWEGGNDASQYLPVNTPNNDKKI